VRFQSTRNKKQRAEVVQRPNQFGYNRILLFYKILETDKVHDFNHLIENSV